MQYFVIDDDRHFQDVIQILSKQGADVQILQPSQTAPEGAITFYTDKEGSTGISALCSIRTACFKVHPVAPENLRTTPFVIAMAPIQNCDFAEKIIGISRQFELWLIGNGGALPWGQRPHSASDELDKWLAWANQVRSISNFRLTEKLHQNGK